MISDKLMLKFLYSIQIWKNVETKESIFLRVHFFNHVLDLLLVSVGRPINGGAFIYTLVYDIPDGCPLRRDSDGGDLCKH